MYRILIFAFVTILSGSTAFTAPASQPSRDAWPLYSRAIDRVMEGYRANIMSPSASDLVYEEYPPYPPKWHEREDTAFKFNAPARVLAHNARSCTIANWPIMPLPNGKVDMRNLNGCRALANDLADAALQEHLSGNDAEAVETIRDLLHLAELLDESPRWTAVQSLVSQGVRMIAVNRLEVITSDVSLTADPADKRRLQIRSARELIQQLFDVHDPAARYTDRLAREAAAGQVTPAAQDRVVLQTRRGQMECNLASMSLAAHLFQTNKRRWPESIDELTAYLPAKPRDPWGAEGYLVIKRGRPDGQDRPLV